MSQILLPDDHFFISTAPQIDKICQPIFNLYGIKGFAYAKIYHDGGVFSLTSDYRYPNLHLASGFPAIAPIPKEYWVNELFYYLPETIKDQRYHKLLKLTREVLNHDHPFYIVERGSNFIEVFAFVTSPDNYMIVNTYLNHLEDFKQFKLYFNYEARNLITEGDAHRIILPESMVPTVPNIDNSDRCMKKQYFSQNIDIKYYSARTLSDKLTKREIDCLYYLTQGYTLKGIAKQTKIGYRTVETHLNNAKRKLNVHTKSELMKMLFKIMNGI